MSARVRNDPRCLAGLRKLRGRACLRQEVRRGWLSINKRESLPSKGLDLGTGLLRSELHLMQASQDPLKSGPADNALPTRWQLGDRLRQLYYSPGVLCLLCLAVHLLQGF